VNVGGMMDLDQFSRKIWLCLTTFGNSTGWSNMEHKGGANIVGYQLFCSLVDRAKGLLGFM
jgi:hypothetical protein